MTSRSINLLESIKQAFLGNQLKPGEILMSDIDTIVTSEIEIAKCGLDEKSLSSIKQKWIRVIKTTDEYDIFSMLILLQTAIECLNLLPDITMYFCKPHWKEQWGEGYNEEVEAVVDNICKKGYISVFNYEFENEYSADKVEVFYDEKIKYHFVIYDGKRMYFPQTWEVERIKDYVASIYIEQSADSPHSYEMAGYGVQPGDVVVDSGTAEGNFALKIVDVASKIYLIEADEEWVSALSHTFKAYESKVVIINKYLDGVISDKQITLDAICDKVNYVKMDIEGYERDALIGAQHIIERSENICFAVCSYHCAGDEEWIASFLKEKGFKTTFSKGYMFPTWDAETLKKAILRRGIVFGRKGA